jgi:hypothetical protein
MQIGIPKPTARDLAPTARVSRINVLMSPDDLQQFKGRCAVRIGEVGDDEGKTLSPETRGALVEHGGGLVRASERVGLFGRMLGL